jgi:hypothetical protein
MQVQGVDHHTCGSLRLLRPLRQQAQTLLQRRHWQAASSSPQQESRQHSVQVQSLPCVRVCALYDGGSGCGGLNR